MKPGRRPASRAPAARPAAAPAPLTLRSAPPRHGLKAYLAAVPLIGIAFAASIALHATMLSLNFVVPHAPRQAKDQALDIVLVNSKSAQRPHDAQVLAQANLDGGGNVDEQRRAKTSLPASHHTHSGDQLEATQQRLRELEARQRALLAQAKKAAPSVSRDQPAEVQPEAPPAVSGRDLAASALAMARLQAEIDRNTDAYNKRPRRQFIGARASEYRFAQYVEDWRLKVERVGTLNYPEAARGKLYGNLQLTAIINADGSVERVDINRSSGHKVLDEAARRIVQMASPYAPFPPDIRRDTDIIEITRTWFFTREDTVQSK